MGILNVTPDSFYDGGLYAGTEDALRQGIRLYNDGAHIIDIGGESSRPGAKPVSPAEEMDRVCPVIERLKGEVPVPLSIDTTKASVAEAAIRAGCSIINDISGLTFDEEMKHVAARNDAEVVLMHIQGTPETMQENPEYGNIILEIKEFLMDSVQKALDAGIEKKKIIIDPGIGFGKTLEQNYIILKHIDTFKDTGYPVLIGLSRKSIIGRLYGDDEDRLPATIALNTAALLSGADIIRVHDVKEHSLALKSIEMYKCVS